MYKKAEKEPEKQRANKKYTKSYKDPVGKRRQIMRHKTYAKKIRQSKRKELLAKIDEAITFHEKFRNAYFFKPPSCAAKRRYYEIYNQREIEFNYNGAKYRYSGFTECSCNNVYYYGSFYMDGDRKTIRVFKKIKQELVEAIEAYEKKHSAN